MGLFVIYPPVTQGVLQQGREEDSLERLYSTGSNIGASRVCGAHKRTACITIVLRLAAVPVPEWRHCLTKSMCAVPFFCLVIYGLASLGPTDYDLHGWR
jgi:hypothetical protein